MHARRLVSPPSCSGGGRPLTLAALARTLFCLLSAELADRTSFTWAGRDGTEPNGKEREGMRWGGTERDGMEWNGAG